MEKEKKEKKVEKAVIHQQVMGKKRPEPFLAGPKSGKFLPEIAGKKGEAQSVGISPGDGFHPFVGRSRSEGLK